DNYSSMTNPGIAVLKDRDGLVARVLEENKELSSKLEGMNLGKVEFGSFTTSENVKLDYWKILPPDFTADKQYPVLFFVYGGPGYQTVKNQWQGANYMWYQYMASKGYIVISVDNRGSGGRGEEFKKLTYLNLGKYETIDYIEAAKFFGNQPYVNKSRIGIFGWSYGGFMASNCITKGADYFKAAVAVAPVTNWRYYDNIYTERYMRTPKENAAGYDDNSPINHVDKIKGSYLLIHGNADDNVHFQNSAEMVMAMNAKNIKYDAEYYPNTNHSIRGGKIRLHLFTKITDFLLLNL
ncbi:MAG TPA: alpha/beta fold hydrolase, partial [Bacteroidia bacterium]